MSAIHDLNDSTDKLHDALCFLEILYLASLKEDRTESFAACAAHVTDLVQDALHSLDAGREKVRQATI
ncbi:MAG: hypothetical protein ACK4GC_04480 [Paracoccaceae bacterium]